MVYMLNHPDVMKRCKREIDDVIGRERAPSMKDKASMPYVEATILEVQRMSNIVPFGVNTSIHFMFLMGNIILPFPLPEEGNVKN